MREETTTSPVHEFGDLDVAKLTVGQFQGTEERKTEEDGGLESAARTDVCKKDAVDNREANR